MIIISVDGFLTETPGHTKLCGYVYLLGWLRIEAFGPWWPTLLSTSGILSRPTWLCTTSTGQWNRNQHTHILRCLNGHVHMGTHIHSTCIHSHILRYKDTDLHKNTEKNIHSQVNADTQCSPASMLVSEVSSFPVFMQTSGESVMS